MKPRDLDNLSQLSMLELFRLEAENQTALLTGGLLELERATAPDAFEALMRAAHSLKGAARIVNLQVAVRIAHAMEDCFVSARQGKLRLRQPEIDLLLHGVDLLTQVAKNTEASVTRWELDHAAEIGRFLSSLAQLVSREMDHPSPDLDRPEAFLPGPNGAVLPDCADYADASSHPLTIRKPESPERVLRLTAENLNRLLGLAGESLAESRWLRPFADSLQRLKHHHSDLTQQLERLRQSLEEDRLSERSENSFRDLFRQLADSRQFLTERMQELDMFDHRSAQLSQRLYLEMLRTRMRPFSDGVRRFPRMVRDLARPLGKTVKLEILGENTQVDRDILERLEAPLAHLLRNAIDHGCESPEVRRRAGKLAESAIRLEARHSAGMLLVTVADDGAGVDLEQVRRAIVQKRLLASAAAERLAESELLEFLFFPGFTLKETVTEISGRGFGLDIVQNMVKSVRGAIRLGNQPGRGLRVQLQLPLTLSVLRALLVEVAGEPYAIPLSQITRVLKLPRAAVQFLEGRPHFHFGDQQIGLISARQLLDHGEPAQPSLDLPVVILGDRNTRYGLVVDRFLGQRELVAQPLDPRLGKVNYICAAALMPDGGPVLILDVEDMKPSGRQWGNLIGAPAA